MRFKTVPRRAYPSDLTNDQWNLLAAALPPERTDGLGRPREVDLREVVNAILYLNRTGCQWDMLPHDFPPKSTVYEYFSQWRNDGTWQKLIDVLRTRVRVAAGADSQRGLHRQSIGEDDRGRRGRTRLRRRQEDQGPEAAFAGRYARSADRGADHRREPRRRRSRSATARASFAAGVSAAGDDLRRQQVPQPSTRGLAHRESTCLAHRSHGTPRRDERLHSVENEVGGGTDQCLERSLPKAQQGLRTNGRIERRNDSSQQRASHAPTTRAVRRSKIRLPSPSGLKPWKRRWFFFG